MEKYQMLLYDKHLGSSLFFEKNHPFFVRYDFGTTIS